MTQDKPAHDETDDYVCRWMCRANDARRRTVRPMVPRLGCACAAARYDFPCTDDSSRGMARMVRRRALLRRQHLVAMDRVDTWHGPHRCHLRSLLGSRRWADPWTAPAGLA